MAQLSDTADLNHYIRDSIKDRRPDKVTAKQIQTVMFGLSKFLGVQKTDTNLIKQTVHDSVLNKVKYSDTAAALLNYRNAIIATKANLDSSKLNLRSEISANAPPCKTISFLLSYNGSVFSSTVLHSDFGATTLSFTAPLNDLVNVTASTAIFTSNKTITPGSSIAAGNPNLGTGNLYMVTGMESTTSVFTLRLPRFDMDESIVPSFEKMYFEIRVYN